MKGNIKWGAIILAIVVAAFFVGKRFNNAIQPSVAATTVTTVQQETQTVSTSQEQSNSSVPQKVLDVLAYVKQHGEAPEGYVGGRVFQNREHRLPPTTTYHEWDVNLKERGQNRGTERLITGEDKSAYFTNDHYRTFTKIE